VKIQTLLEFLKIVKEYQEVGVINVVVMRNQAEKAVTVHLK